MKIVKFSDVKLLENFTCGIPSMDKFIHDGLQLSINHGYCRAYIVYDKDRVAALFALSFDSIDLDSDDRMELTTGVSSAGIPDVSFDYEETFYGKRRYPALDIAYLAVSKEYQGNKLGAALITEIIRMAVDQDFAGCQFLSVEALKTKEYSAVGFYDKCGFAPNEYPNPNKDTLRMFKTLKCKNGEISKYTPAERQDYEESLKNFRDWYSCLTTAEKKGRAEGRAEGREESKVEIARNMKKDGMPVNVIVKYTGITEDEINNL